MKREDLLKKSTSDMEEVIFQLRTEKKEFEIWIIIKEKEVADLELRIKRMKSSKILDVDEILNATDELSLIKRRLKQGKELMEELFDTSDE